MHAVTVREYARITTGPMAVANRLDQAAVSDVAFDWLCKESERLRKAGAGLVQLEGRRWLRLDNYVGVLEAPDGTRIEILPKTFDDGDDATQARRLSSQMSSCGGKTSGSSNNTTGKSNVRAAKS